MKFVAIALLVAVAGPAAAATPTETYLATKGKAVAALKHPEDAPRLPGHDKLEADALRTLSSLIRTIVGPLGVRGFPAHGESNIVSLSDGDMESGHVDGIRVASPDKTSLLVTTAPLVRSWLRANAWWAPLPLDPATDVGKALLDGPFYTQALASDAAVNVYAEVPLPPKRGGAVTHALLTKKSQDRAAPSPPDGLIVSVVRGGRVFIFDKPLKTARLAIAACETAWTAERDRIQLLFDAARDASDPAAAIQGPQGLADKAEAAFLACYGEKLATQPFFPGLVRQAQELAGRAG